MSQAIATRKMKWPRTWYPVRRVDEVPAGTVMPIRALGDDYIIVRSPQGKLAFLEGHCTHRGASLGDGGKFVGECIQCPFHGLEYNLDGKCVKVPGEGRASRTAVLRSYPVAESMGMIWMYYGQEPAFPPPSLDNCGVTKEVGDQGNLAAVYGFRNTRNCLMRDSICGSLDYMHGTLVHGGIAKLETLEQPTPHQLIVTLDVQYTDGGFLNHRRWAGFGDKVKYRGQYWGPAIVYTHFWGKKTMLGHIRTCLPIEENRTQTDLLFVVKTRGRRHRIPKVDVAIRKMFAKHQDDEDAFLDRQKPRAMYMKNFDEGMIAHHKMCLRLGQDSFEGREPFMVDERGDDDRFAILGNQNDSSASQREEEMEQSVRR